MYKTTKAQRKFRGQIDMWLKGEMELDPDEVREKYISSWDPAPMGEFYTPPGIVDQAEGLLFYPQGSEVLDPCAGIGAMVKPFLEAHESWQYNVTAYELSDEAAGILKRLYPDLSAHHVDVFDRLDEIEGKFNYVMMNPPFGAVAGQQAAAEKCESGVTRSEHRFFELAVRALCPGGLAIIIAPPEFINSIPKKARSWFDDRMHVETSLRLDGKFKFANIAVDAFVISV